MKMRPFHLFKLAATALLTLPALAFAVPAATSPYYSDTVNSYVQDQVSDDMEGLNSLLCMMGAMAPNQMVNGGDYIALIDQNICESSGSGGQSSNTGADYMAVQVNASRASNASPMLTKIWFDFPNYTVPMYASATQGPSSKLPYGVFRMDYCVNFGTSTCDAQKGYIDATKSGLAFYTSSKSTSYFYELALQLTASTTANSGSGIVVKSNKTSSTGAVTTTATVFAYSPNYFYRDDGNTNGDKCFNRSPDYAEESAWRYGLYHADTGEQLKLQSGFPIEYTDTSVTPNVTYNGYMGYYGISMSFDAPTGSTVNQITYDTNPPTKTPYTLLKTGGKLTKYSTVTKTLAALHKVTFWYWAQSDIPVSAPIMTASSYYELYWDNSLGNFMVSGKYNSTSGNMEPYTTPVAVTNANMVLADPNGWGISGWSQLVGGQFSIKGSDFALLVSTTSSTPVITQTQDVVYPQDFAAINTAGGLQCIGDCPNVSATLDNPGYWGPFTTLYGYSLNTATGNLQDALPVGGIPGGSPVVKTTSGTLYSGKLVTASDMALIQAAKACSPSCTYNQSDVDLLSGLVATPTYYVWQTSSDSWSQMAFLLDALQNTVIFYPPLPVNFTVPIETAYGTEAGATISLQYSDFGNLWGIPNKCIDITTNEDCVFTGTTPPPTTSANQRWTPKFSIPFDTTVGVVTAGITQGTIAQNTKFLVKALDKEIRLAQVPVNICTVLGLTKPISVTKLPSSDDWINPIPSIGTKQVLNPVPAPQVIHGVKQY